MKKALFWILGIIILLLLAAWIAGGYYFSNILLSRPTQELADGEARLEELYAEMDLPGDFSLPVPQEVSIAAGDVTLAGNFYENEADGDCAVLMLHGYTGTRYGVLQYAPLFWQRGCHLLAYDARGHGASTDTPHTYGYHEKVDGQAAYEWLLSRTGLSPSQVGVTGVSYGAATSLQMLPLRPEVAFVLADSPFQNLWTIVQYQAVQQFGTWIGPFIPVAALISEIRADFDIDDVSPKNGIAGGASPVLLVHSLTDTFTPWTHSEAIYENSNQAQTVLIINEWGSAHAADIITDYATYDALVDDFLAQYAPGFGE